MSENFEQPKCKKCGADISIISVIDHKGQQRWNICEPKPVYFTRNTGKKEEGKYIFENFPLYTPHVCKETTPF